MRQSGWGLDPRNQPDLHGFLSFWPLWWSAGTEYEIRDQHLADDLLIKSHQQVISKWSASWSAKSLGISSFLEFVFHTSACWNISGFCIPCYIELWCNRVNPANDLTLQHLIMQCFSADRTIQFTCFYSSIHNAYTELEPRTLNRENIEF